MSWLCVSVTSSPVALVSWTVRERGLNFFSFILTWRLGGGVEFLCTKVGQWVEYYMMVISRIGVYIKEASFVIWLM